VHEVPAVFVPRISQTPGSCNRFVLNVNSGGGGPMGTPSNATSDDSFVCASAGPANEGTTTRARHRAGRERPGIRV
jgi:hypothetical protein